MNPSVTVDDAVPDVDVLIETERWRDVVPEIETICRAAVTATVRYAETTRPPKDMHVCILLADDACLRDLNHRFRGIDRPTNVLSFPAVEPDVLAAIGADGPPPDLGDIAIAFETMAAEAKCDGKPLANHLSHLVIHATLHLLGHDHEMEAEAAAMEALETQILAQMGVADPYAEPGNSLQ